jgi:hypothetical protein
VKEIKEDSLIKLENQRTLRDQIKFPFKGKEGAANPAVKYLLSSHEQTEISEYEEIYYLASNKY